MDTQSKNENNNLLELENLKIQIQNETDEEKKYILQIKLQKMQREEIIRQKETKRKLEVICIVFVIKITNSLTFSFCYLKGLAIPITRSMSKM